jgi:ketosteroid isomerase-like protein
VLAACQATPPPLSEADKAAIKAVSDSFVAYVRSNRDSAAASLFTEHAVWMPANRGIVEGRPAILAAFQARPGLDFAVTNIDIDGRGDLAYVRGAYAFAMMSRDGKSAIGDYGKFVEIRRRQADGRWLIASDIFNSDQPVR